MSRTRQALTAFVTNVGVVVSHATREAGLVIAEIGLAVVVPAEFVVVRVTQSASGVTVTEPTGSLKTMRR